MKKIALIGDLQGPGFAALRTGWFRDARPDADIFDWRDPELEHRVASAEAIVTAGIYGPTKAAMRVVGDRPLWLDLPGDPFADAQAAAGRGQTEALEEARKVFIPAIHRADAFSSISQPAADALRGQLGMLGREELPVAVLPIPYAFVQPEAEVKHPRDATPIRIGLVGSFNTWFDEQCLADALIGLGRQQPIEVRVIGGDVPGHFSGGYQHFRQLIEASPIRERVCWHPVAQDRELPALLQDCEVGVVLDRPGWEPYFGSRTRLLFYLWMGMRVVGSVRCELAIQLTRAGFLQGVPLGDTSAVIHAIGQRRPLPDRRWLRENYDPVRLMEPLRSWKPERQPATPETEPLGALLQERERLQAELAAVRASRTWILLDRVHRLKKAVVG